MASDPALDFAIDLDSVRDRLGTLAYFNGVTNIQDATNVLEGMSAAPPWAFVSIARESAEPNKTIGGHAQRVNVSISTLFCVAAERAAGDSSDVVEQTRKAIMRILVAWTPRGAERPLGFERYLLRASGDGLIWGEVLMGTAYRFTAS